MQNSKYAPQIHLQICMVYNSSERLPSKKWDDMEDWTWTLHWKWNVRFTCSFVIEIMLFIYRLHWRTNTSFKAWNIQTHLTSIMQHMSEHRLILSWFYPLKFKIHSWSNQFVHIVTNIKWVSSAFCPETSNVTKAL